MKLLMHILKKNEKLGIDNEKLTFAEIKAKLTEEFIEVIDEISKYIEEPTLKNLRRIVSESFDLGQMIILIMWRCNRAAKELGNDNLVQECNFEHKDKLITERGWIIETRIEIDIKE